MTTPSAPFPWVAHTRDEIRHRAASWLSSPDLASLIAQLGGPAIRDDEQSREELRHWTAANFDLRQGGERRDARHVPLTTREQQSLIRAAGPLGLLQTTGPVANRYDAIIILGGATTGNRLRTELARDVHRRVGAALVVGASSHRPLTDNEHRTDPDSVNDMYEWRHLRRMMEELLNQNGPDRWRTEGDKSVQDGWQTKTPAGTILSVLVAPDVDGRRATTKDQLVFLGERIPPQRRKNVLLVTSAIYVPYQFFAAAGSLLEHDSDRVEMIGTATSIQGAPALLARRIMQEVHATIEAGVQALRSSGA